jgi:small subunit ribosomal protein S9
MNEDEKQQNETSGESQEPTPQDDAPQAAGPVDEDASPSSRDDAAGEEAPSTPPAAEAKGSDGEGSDDSAEEAPADPGREAEESAVDGEAASPSEEESQSDSSTTSEGDEAPEASEDEEPEAAEEPQAEAEPQAKEKKADVIPGADLEPIAVEEEERPLSAEEQARREAEEEERARREAELSGEAGEEYEDRPAPRAPAKLEGDARYLATGKRKSAIARVILLPGSGEIVINRRPLEEFFPRPLHQTMARQPLATTGYEGSVDVRVRVHGGGVGGQAGAVRHGIARALTEVDPELRSELKRRGFLTRDARVKERRKAGLKKARKRPQFSKR